MPFPSLSLSLPNYYRVTRASALYDLVVTAPFATPWTFILFYPYLAEMNIWLGGGPLAPFGRIHTLMACLLGSLVMLWAATRLLEPSLALGRRDGAGRFLFAAWMTWTMSQGGMPLLWLFLVPELLWGVAQWWPVAPVAASDCRRKTNLTLVRAS